jgi:putative FmdB family regulatory protein
MPLYEYYCADCRTKFEALRPMDRADAAIQCKQCESVRTSRVLSLFATFNRGESSSSPTLSPSSGGQRGGCCGGMCGCAH